MDWSLLEKWDLVFGVLGGVVLILGATRYVLSTIRFLKEYRITRYVEGEWKGYYIIFIEGKPQIIEEKWIVKREFPDRLTVTTESLPNKDLSYKGVIYSQLGHMVVRLNAVEYPEEVFCRFNLPIPSHSNLILGFWLGIDFNGHISVGPHLLSRESLTEDDIRRIVTTMVQVDKPARIMKLVE